MTHEPPRVPHGPYPSHMREAADARTQDLIRQQIRENHEAEMAALKAAHPYKPRGFEKPPYNTPAYWRAYRLGWISEAEAETDQAFYDARRQRAKDSYGTRASNPARHSRPEPRDSRQYAQEMATTAARDSRLTPGSFRLLAVLRARCGNGTATDTTKTTLAAVLSVSPRTIQRYLAELVKFGYITKSTLRSKVTGFDVGLRVFITRKVLPFFRAFRPKKRGNSGQTASSLIKHPTGAESKTFVGNGGFKGFGEVVDKLIPT